MIKVSEQCGVGELELAGVDVEEAVNRLIRYAASLPASDLFFTWNEHDVTVSVRHLGILKHLMNLAPETGRHFINSIEASAGMDVAKRFHPLDGRWVCELENGRKVDLRINTIPSLYGESMAIRLLDREIGLMDLHGLGLERKDLDDLIEMLSRPSGLILVTGPTGAGKTTTSYACLQYLNDGTRKINTIEDPIEHSLEGICQSQVNPRLHLDFPELLRGVLRQAPDVIKVGEVRDPVTAATAVQAASSGCLVFATLHAPTAAAAVDSMLALGVHPHFLATSLLGVAAQRLVRTLCEQCKVVFDMPGVSQLFDGVKRWLQPGQGENVYTSYGCENCHREGFAGRTGVFEMLRATDDVRQFVFEGRSTREIHHKAMEHGMTDLRQSGLLKVAQGITSTEEIVRTIPGE